ncbi:hypothetical protein DAERI_030324 [Deinococcus aerius]|uniref:Uncharacterized protein n=1 Tax=Deinococcus aerius TaxID=200253 RepID=A0A2I9DGB4_9DEIO|nr:hypothetical protein [Deinococcus aerius]GBF05158.1 hypothetical protein DAERI_030324 [Deinococcus aerius]
MRKPVLLALTVLLSAPALAWVPKLEETTAKNVIDGAYGRRDPVPTYQTIDLNVKDGKFAAGEGVVKAFDGGDQCVADWLAKPTDFTGGSRPATITASGQADQLYFQAVDARDNFKNLSAADALGADLAGKRLADGLLRVDINVRGLPSEKARDAYLVRLKGKDGKMVAPARRSFVNDFKQDAGTWTGTLVYYFEPLKAGIGASDKVEMLLRTEADTNCAYSVTLDLGSFQ